MLQDALVAKDRVLRVDETVDQELSYFDKDNGADGEDAWDLNDF